MRYVDMWSGDGTWENRVCGLIQTGVNEVQTSYTTKVFTMANGVTSVYYAPTGKMSQTIELDFQGNINDVMRMMKAPMLVLTNLFVPDGINSPPSGTEEPTAGGNLVLMQSDATFTTISNAQRLYHITLPVDFICQEKSVWISRVLVPVIAMSYNGMPTAQGLRITDETGEEDGAIIDAKNARLIAPHEVQLPTYTATETEIANGKVYAKFGAFYDSIWDGAKNNVTIERITQGTDPQTAGIERNVEKITLALKKAVNEFVFTLTRTYGGHTLTAKYHFHILAPGLEE